MHLRELFLKEDDRSTAVFAFGRFNPPTIGHEKLIQKVQSTAAKVNGKGYVFLSHTSGTEKDPLDLTTKLSYLRQHFKSDPKLSFGDIRANTIIKVMKVLEQEGRTKVIMIAGDDRVMEFTKLLNQYNGKPTKAGNVEYTFDSVQVISAGQRDPDASDITGVSASKARELAMKGQEHEFSKIVMGGDNGKVLYDRIQDQFGKQVDENNKKLYNEDMEDAKPVVYLDMDGVLADFFGGVEKMYGVEHWKQLTKDKTKDLKKKREIIENELMDLIKKNNLEDKKFLFNDRKIFINKCTTLAPLNIKILEEVLNKYLDKSKANMILKEIEKYRNDNKKEVIKVKRKLDKKSLKKKKTY